MTPDQRHQMMLNYEGQCLTIAGNQGVEGACAVTRCYIDGAMNALVRMQGPEEASKFAFALCDRVAGGLRAPTAWPIALPSTVESTALKAVEIAVQPPAKPSRKLPLIWWACGFVAGLFVGGTSQ